jgi:adenylate kinase
MAKTRTYEHYLYFKEQLAIQEKKLAEAKKLKLPEEREKYRQLEIAKLEKIVQDFKNKISTIQASLTTQNSAGPGGPKK